MKKKVLFVITKSNFGGAQRYVFDLATNLPDAYEAVVAAGGAGELFSKLAARNIRTISIPHLERDISFFKEISVLFSLITIFKTEKPDVVHLNSSKIGGEGALAARIAGVPKIIFTAHGWAFGEPVNPIAKLFRWVASLATAMLAHRVIAVSMYDQKRSPLPAKTSLIYNGISAFEVAAKGAARATLASRAGLLNLEGVWVGTIAELTKTKGLPYLIEGMRDTFSVHLFIVGEGEERGALLETIRRLDLSSRVHLVGNIADARTYLSAFDIVALPSVKEGLPYALLEAGHAGSAVVATSVGGIPEIISGSGVLVPAKDTKALAEAINTLIKKPDAREAYGAALKKKIEENFSLPPMIEKTAALYQDTPTTS